LEKLYAAQRYEESGRERKREEGKREGEIEEKGERSKRERERGLLR